MREVWVTLDEAALGKSGNVIWLDFEGLSGVAVALHLIPVAFIEQKSSVFLQDIHEDAVLQSSRHLYPFSFRDGQCPSSQ